MGSFEGAMLLYYSSVDLLFLSIFFFILPDSEAEPATVWSPSHYCVLWGKDGER